MEVVFQVVARHRCEAASHITKPVFLTWRTFYFFRHQTTIDVWYKLQNQNSHFNDVKTFHIDISISLLIYVLNDDKYSDIYFSFPLIFVGLMMYFEAFL